MTAPAGGLTGGFASELSVQGVTATRWVITSPLVWTGTDGATWTVPVGFVTDFATVPRFLHWLISPYGAYTRAAVLHDWLLHLLAQARRNGTTPPLTSRDADGVFRRVLQDLEVSWVRRWTMWAGVRAASCFNADRSYGRAFWRDAPAVLGMLLLVLATVVIPVAALTVLLALGLLRLLIALAPDPSRVARRRGRRSSIH